MSLFLQHLFLNDLLLLHFLRTPKSDYDMYGEEKASMLHIAEETAEKTSSGYVQLWEPLENSDRMPGLGDAVCVPGWMGHRCLRDRWSYVTPALSSLCE